MLVLTRNEGQAVLIGDAVKLTVLSVRAGQVRFGVQAPGDVVVLREELARRGGAAARPDKPPGD